MLYLPRDPTSSAVFFRTSRVDGALTVFVWEDYQCYFVVMDSQCDAFKVYLTRCFVIIYHSSSLA